MSTTTATHQLSFCDVCGERDHRADYSHQSTHGDHAVYAVVCPTEPDLVGFYTDEVVTEVSA